MVAVVAHHLHVARVARVAGDDDAVAAVARGLRPLGRERVVEAGDVLEDDRAARRRRCLAPRSASPRSCPSSTTPKPRSIFSGAGCRSWTSRSSSISTPRPAASALTVPPHANDSTPGIKQQRRRVERLAEAHRVEQHRRLRVGRVVDDLHHAQRVDVLARAGEHERQEVVRPAGIDARREARHAGVAHASSSGRAHLGLDVRREHERHDRARHDVLARRRDARHVGDRFGRSQVGGRGVARRSRRRARAARRRRSSRARRADRCRRARPRPCPALSALCTHSPTSSRSG